MSDVPGGCGTADEGIRLDGVRLAPAQADGGRIYLQGGLGSARQGDDLLVGGPSATIGPAERHSIRMTPGAGMGGKDGDVLIVHPRPDSTSKLECQLPATFADDVSFGSQVTIATDPALHEIVSLDQDGQVVVAPPPDQGVLATAARRHERGSLNSVLLALATEVARLRWEVERLKDRVT